MRCTIRYTSRARKDNNNIETSKRGRRIGETVGKARLGRPYGEWRGGPRKVGRGAQDWGKYIHTLTAAGATVLMTLVRLAMAV